MSNPRQGMKTSKQIRDDVKAIVESHPDDLINHVSAYVIRQRNDLRLYFVAEIDRAERSEK